MRSWKRKSDAVSPTTSGASHAHSSTTSEDDNSLAGDDELHQIEDVQSAVEELLKGESAVELLKKQPQINTHINMKIQQNVKKVILGHGKEKVVLDYLPHLKLIFQVLQIKNIELNSLCLSVKFVDLLARLFLQGK